MSETSLRRSLRENRSGTEPPPEPNVAGRGDAPEMSCNGTRAESECFFVMQEACRSDFRALGSFSELPPND